MKPAAFTYVAPQSVAEALALKSEHGEDAKYLAGGQSLIPAMNFRVMQPTALIDLNRIKALDYIREDGDELRIGALTRYSAVEHHPLVAARLPLAAEVIGHVAHPQIRNRGTLGGSLAHADPAAEMPVLLSVLSGRVLAASARGERWIPADAFMLGPFTTVLEPDELLIEIALPALPPGVGAAFREVARRHGDYALLGAAATLSLGTDGKIAAARLVFLNAGETPRAAGAAVIGLIGQTPSEALFAQAAQTIDSDIEPLGTLHASPDYQRHLARVLARRVLAEAAARATQSIEASPA